MSVDYKDYEGSDLSGRRREILRLVVSSYIETGQPVSSLYIAENFDVGVSSATIRAILVELESKRYLYSNYRTAGRIPTSRAFRFYVSQLPQERSIGEEERRFIQTEYLKRDFRLPEVLEVTSRVLSALTDSAGVVLGPEPEQSVLKHIELIDMGQDEVLLIIVNRSGTVYSKHLYLEQRIPTDYLKQISSYLNELFKGCDLVELRSQLAEVSRTGEASIKYLASVASTINHHLDAVRGGEELYTSGLDRLIARAAAGELDRMKVLGELFSSGDYLRTTFREAVNLDDIVIRIEEQSDSSLPSLSLITSSYKMGEKRIGAIGVVAPVCTDYLRTVSIVDYISLIISNMITRMSN